MAGRPRNIENIYNAPKSNTQFSEGQKSKGILDDYAERGNIDTKEGTIQDVPTEAKHIVNKEYVDAYNTTFTAGSVVFSDGSNLAQDNANFFWDDTNNRLGLGTTSPTAPLHIKGSGTTGNLVIQSDLDVADRIIEWENATGVVEWRLGLDNGVGITKFSIGEINNTAHFVIEKTTGKVGIGKTNPAYKLDIDAGASTNVFSGSSSNNPILKIVDTTNNVNTIIQSFNTDGWVGTQSNHPLRLATNNTEKVSILADGKVGIGIETPTTQFSVKEKSGMSAIGGFCIKLTNKTGANSVAGQLVKTYITTAIDDAVMLTAAGDVECFGVFLDSGIADGSEAWVVVAGIADVAFDDNVAAARGDWVSTGVLAGYAAAAASPAAAPTHFEEIGHCIESVAAGGGGTHILARCVLHFN